MTDWMKQYEELGKRIGRLNVILLLTREAQQRGLIRVTSWKGDDGLPEIQYMGKGERNG